MPEPDFPRVLTHEQRSIIEPAARRLQAAQLEVQRIQGEIGDLIALAAGRRDVTLAMGTWTMELVPAEPVD